MEAGQLQRVLNRGPGVGRTAERNEDSLDHRAGLRPGQGPPVSAGASTASGTGTYIGNGTATLLPKMDIVTKDFNPYATEGKQVKLGYIDILTDETTNGKITINLFADTTVKEAGNLNVGQTQMQTQDNPLFSPQNSDITWNRFFSTLFGQYISVEITYDDDIMNDKALLEQPFVMNAVMLWIKAGGRISS